MTSFAQNDVTKFLGIPVDGTKTAMIQQLKEKGYTYMIDLATGAAVYVGTDAVDATKDVKAKLGIK